MTKIYLINNACTLNNINYPEDNLELKREKRILSIEGEDLSKKLATSDLLEDVNLIYASGYVMSVGTAKYLADKLDLSIGIAPEIGERILGNIGSKKISYITEMQENDFNYKLSGGESLNEVKSRMNKFIQNLLFHHDGGSIALFTHNVAITCLLSMYCDKGFNLDNRLILNYKDDAIIDGTWDGITIIELDFDCDELMSVKRKKIN